MCCLLFYCAFMILCCLVGVINDDDDDIHPIAMSFDLLLLQCVTQLSTAMVK